MAKKFRSRKSTGPVYPPGVSQTFVDTVRDLQTDEERKKLIFDMEKGIHDTQIYLQTKKEIVEARAALKNLTSSSTTTIKHMQNRIKFVIEELKRTGAVQDPNENINGPTSEQLEKQGTAIIKANA
jgi:hypothetical protein